MQKCKMTRRASSTLEKDMEMKKYHLKFMIKEIPLQKDKHNSDEVYIT